MNYDKALDYIDKYWEELTVFAPEDNGIRIGLPHHFMQPNGDAFGADMFYWDSFFISLGVLLDESKVAFVKGVIDNFRFLQHKFGIIPARNKYYNLGISQPPFLSTMVAMVYHITKDQHWLRECVHVIEKELNDYWKGKNLEYHQLDIGLSRYCDHNITHQTAEHESGWDMTSRFHDACLDYAPIDLNCCLYKYETDLAYFYRELGEEQRARHYDDEAAHRKHLINKYCWHEDLGFYFDYNHHKQEQSLFFSLAGFFPLWCGIANEEQAHRMVDHLKLFEFDGGLATTQKEGLDETFKQWDYPNGWANLQWIVIVGLEHYHYRDDAKRIAMKWLELNNMIFEETGKFWEKYDVVDLKIGKDGRYPTQHGFGWTNAVFAWLCKRYC